jgi:hypothetical protein
MSNVRKYLASAQKNAMESLSINLKKTSSLFRVMTVVNSGNGLKNETLIPRIFLANWVSHNTQQWRLSKDGFFSQQQSKNHINTLIH